MFGEGVIEREVQKMERVRKRPFSPSTKRVILAAGEDPVELIQKRVLKLRGKRQARDRARLEFFEHVLETMDFARYHELQQRLLTPASLRAHGWRIKYLNLDYWLGAKLEMALDLGLHESEPLKILDIGVGAGHFPFICQLLGHEVVGTDIEDLPLDWGGWLRWLRQLGARLEDLRLGRARRWGGRHVYDGLIDILGVDRRAHAVERQVPLPDFGGPFDLVTALMVKFDHVLPDKRPIWQRWRRGGRSLTAWEPSDWRFFLDDLAANALAPGGRVYLKLNRPFAGDTIMGFMEGAGGKTDRPQCVVLFDSLTEAAAPALA